MINILAVLLMTFTQQTQQVNVNVEQLLIDRAIVYGASPSEVLRVARCENTNLTPGLRNFAGSDAIGIGQWIPGGHWTRTPHYREVGIDIHHAYAVGNPDALYYDVDGFAWSFGRAALAQYPYNREGWLCF